MTEALAVRNVLWLNIAKICAVATLVNVVVLFGTAGMLIQKDQLEDVHGTAAIVLHVLTGALALALIAAAVQRQCAWWPAGLAVLLFAYTFLQAYLGKGRTLYLHIPGALLVVIAAVWLTAWLFVRRRAADAHSR
jgi:hypothetical protein